MATFYLIRSDLSYAPILIAMVTIKIYNAGVSIQSEHVAGTTAERLVVSLMAKDKEKEGEKSKKKLQKVCSMVIMSLILC
jgi:hypothetical protein